jgi:hypothetical protein
MDIQARKIEFIKQFLNIQSESLIEEFESLLKDSKKSENPMPKDELIERIKKSEADFDNGHYKSTSELIDKYK